MGAKAFASRDIRNVALVGHQGAGKTAIADAMLYNTGATSSLGVTTEGTSAFDFEPEEVRKGASIQSSFGWCEYEGAKINIIDTPGDIDFAYDGFAALHAADAMILVLGADDGVEVGTERFWQRAGEMGMPRFVFINKMDHPAADTGRLLNEIREQLGAEPVPVQLPLGFGPAFHGVVSLFQKKAMVWAPDGGSPSLEPIPDELRVEAERMWDHLVETVAATDDELLEHYLETFELSKKQMARGFRGAVNRGQIVPVLYGCASANIGIQPLLALIELGAPSPLDAHPFPGTTVDGDPIMIERDPKGPFCAQVVHTSVDRRGKPLSVMKVLRGAPDHRNALNPRTGASEKVNRALALRGWEQDKIKTVAYGDIVAVTKLKDTHTNDTLCDKKHPVLAQAVEYPPPMMAFALRAAPADQDLLETALAQLVEADPSIRTSEDDLTDATVVHGMGEAHLRLAVARLNRIHGLQLEIDLPSVPYRETFTEAVRGAQGHFQAPVEDGGAFGACVIDIEPLPRGSGIEVGGDSGRQVPANYLPAIEEGIRLGLRQGSVAGFPITDVRVTIVGGDFHTVDSNDDAFRSAGTLAVQTAGRTATCQVLEPICSLEIVAPQDALGDLTGDVAARRGRILGMDTRGTKTVLFAEVPRVETLRYATDLKSMTHGKGTFTASIRGYEPMPASLVDALRRATTSGAFRVHPPAH